MGVVPDGLRRRVFERDGHRCLMCGCRENLTVDHVKPRSRGGSDSIYNLQTLCGPCNQEKGNKHLYELDMRKNKTDRARRDLERLKEKVRGPKVKKFKTKRYK